MLNLDALVAEPVSVDVLISGRTTVTLGGVDYVIPAQSMQGDEDWIAGLDARLRGLISALGKAGDNTTAVMAMLSAFQAELLDALVSYAPEVLPPTTELKQAARAHELLIAVAKVWRLANPLVGVAAMGLARRQQTNGTPSGPTTTSPARSSGRSRKSGGA